MANLSAYFIRELVFIGNNKNKMSAWNCNKAKKKPYLRHISTECAR